MNGKIRRDIMTKLTVPLWPTAGKALGLGRSSTYEGARTGEIETIKVGRRQPVSTAFLRRKLGLEEPRTLKERRNDLMTRKTNEPLERRADDQYTEQDCLEIVKYCLEKQNEPMYSEIKRLRAKIAEMADEIERLRDVLAWLGINPNARVESAKGAAQAWRSPLV
jgi:hypothetical protein